MKKVLITGASGLVGRRLTELLLNKGYAVNVLGRMKPATDNRQLTTEHYTWDIDKGKIDPEAFEGVSAIIHLAGAGVAEKRWTDERKKEIVDSRVKSANLIFNYLKKNKHGVKTFVSAAAVGYYGDCGEEVVMEGKAAGEGFLSEVCQKWEAAAVKFTQLNIREVRCRIGIVLAKQGGALPELTKTFPLGVAGYFAKSPLYYPWIHIDDVCGIMIHALENEQMHGAYNTTAPAPLPMKSLMQEIVKAKKAKAAVVPVPPFAIKLAMGEMSEMLLSSQRCSAAKILESGYKFKYAEIGKALKAVV
jgi:uncharacterized protein (TIGR01777 family)